MPTDLPFIDFQGAVYRALVISSGAHLVVVKQRLANITRRAERAV